MDEDTTQGTPETPDAPEVPEPPAPIEPAAEIEAVETPAPEPPAAPAAEADAPPVAPEAPAAEAPAPPPPPAAPPAAPAAPVAAPVAPTAATSVIAGEKSKIVAGILAILLGALGIHKFYLGYQKEGIIMIAVTVLGSWILGIGPAVMSLIGVIEGVMYLVKSDAEFEATYVVGRKPWF